MRVHFTHRFSETARLILEEDTDGFSVFYLTHEPFEGHEDAWFVNNTETFADYNDALEAFRRRRDSDNPVATISKYSYMTKTFILE